MHLALNRATHILALVLVASLSACSHTPTSVGIEPEVANNLDSFEYQISNIQNYSGTAEYTWQNSGTSATINLATSPTSGTGAIVVLDGAGQQVFMHSLAENGTFVTSSGTAGSWTIRVVYSSFTGTTNFRAEKAT